MWGLILRGGDSVGWRFWGSGSGPGCNRGLITTYDRLGFGVQGLGLRVEEFRVSVGLGVILDCFCQCSRSNIRLNPKS